MTLWKAGSVEWLVNPEPDGLDLWGEEEIKMWKTRGQTFKKIKKGRKVMD